MTEPIATPEAPKAAETPAPESEKQPTYRSQKMEQAAKTEAREAAVVEEGKDAQPRDESGQFAKVEGQTADKTGDVDSPKPKKGKTAQERIDQLTREKYEAERRAARAEGLAEGRKAPEPEPEKPTVVEPMPADPKDPEPKAEDFESPEAYYREDARWAARQETRALHAEREKKEKTLHLEREQNKMRQDWMAKADKGRAAHPDWDEVVDNPKATASPVMLEEIQASDLGAEIAYYLGRTPEESVRIASLDPRTQVREIAKIEAKLESERVASTPTNNAGDEPAPASSDSEVMGEDEPRRPSQTRAAAPLTPVKGGERAIPDLERLAATNQAEFMRVRNKQEAEQRRRNE